jgi:hypothetical protein
MYGWSTAMLATVIVKVQNGRCSSRHSRFWILRAEGNNRDRFLERFGKKIDMNTVRTLAAEYSIGLIRCPFS